MRISGAVVTSKQVTVIQKLFKMFGREFHIQPESVRGSENVWVEIYSNVISFGGGWNHTKSHIFGFDLFIESCRKELTKRFKLIE